MGCCGNTPGVPRTHPTANPSGATIILKFTPGGGPHSLRGPITKTNYRVGSDGILRPAVYIEDAQIILKYGKFEEV